MKRKTILSIVTSMFVAGILFSCGVIMFRDVNCRGFEFHDDLKWYAGNVGDILIFKNQKNETKEFTIEDKFLSHRTKYVSDTGCGCHDVWGITLTDGKDSIVMFSESKYVEKKSANRYEHFAIGQNKKISGFITADKSIVKNHMIGDVNFSEVMIFEYGHKETDQFNKVVVAPQIGVAQFIGTNGDVWTNVDLSTKLDISFESFKYRENTCQ